VKTSTTAKNSANLITLPLKAISKPFNRLSTVVACRLGQLCGPVYPYGLARCGYLSLR
jgi:hypothetical protein